MLRSNQLSYVAEMARIIPIPRRAVNTHPQKIFRCFQSLSIEAPGGRDGRGLVAITLILSAPASARFSGPAARGSGKRMAWQWYISRIFYSGPAHGSFGSTASRTRSPAGGQTACPAGGTPVPGDVRGGQRAYRAGHV